MKHNNIRFMAILIATLMFVSSITTVAFAAELADNNVQSESYITLTPVENVAVPYGSFTTFVSFDPMERTGMKSFEMTIGHDCAGRIMFNGFYTNGSSGTMQIQWDKTSGGVPCSGSTTFQMNRTSSAVNIGTLRAGTYWVRLWPNQISTQYFCSGQVYCLNY